MSDDTELRAAAQEAVEALDRSFKAALTVKGCLDQPYPDAPHLSPWTRYAGPASRAAYDARNRLRRALVAPEPQRCPTCGSEARERCGFSHANFIEGPCCNHPWHRPVPLVEGEQG